MKKEIELKPKKPKLAYVGMDKKTIAEAVPTQVVEIVYPSKAEKKDEETLFAKGEFQAKITKLSDLPKNRLIWTNDNLVALKTLLDEKDSVSGEYKYRNKIDLIYIDPPFMVQNDFVSENSIDIEVDEEEGVMSVKEPTIIETIAYKDTWQNGLDSFLQMMHERLSLMKDLLAPTGLIFVHLDWHAVSYVKVLMDEIFDYSNFRNEIIAEKSGKNYLEKEEVNKLPSRHDTILVYSNSDAAFIYPVFLDYTNEDLSDATLSQIMKTYKYKKEFEVMEKDSAGTYYWHGFLAPGDRPTMNYELFGKRAPRGSHYYWTEYRTRRAIKNYNLSIQIEKDKKLDLETKIKKLKELAKEGILKKNENDSPIYKVYKTGEFFAGDVWNDIPVYGGGDYPTAKTVKLMRRIIEMSCTPNSIVLDAFIGSGTTCEAAEQLANELNCSWIGIDNSKFAIHTARKRLIELNGKAKGKKGEGLYKVRPFTVENMGYYQRGVKWDAIQVGKQADTYRQAIIELFGGEYAPYSKLLHGKKRGAWIHVGPLSQPLVAEQVQAIAKEVKDTDFKKCYVLSADFTAHLNQAVEEAKKEFGVQITTRIIPASAIDEVKKRLELIKQGVKNPEKVSDMPNIAFFAPLAVKIHKVADGKEAMIELTGLEVDAESFLESQKPERRDELKKWLKKEKSWRSFVDFWAIDWNYESLKNSEDGHGPIFENEWQSFRKRKGKKMVEDLVFKAFHTYEKSGEYTIAVKVTDVFGNDGIITTKVVIK